MLLFVVAVEKSESNGMPLTKHSEATLAEFYSAIGAWEDAYTNSSFLFVALKEGDHFEILQAAFWLSGDLSPVPFSTFRTENVLAGHVKLTEWGSSYKEIIGDLLLGKVETPIGDLYFSTMADQAHHSLNYTPVHPTTQTSQRRVNVVKLGGGQPHAALLKLPLLDWELRAAITPYESLNELLQTYNLGALFGDVKTIEVVATPVMSIAESSSIRGVTASIDIELASVLVSSKASVGYRVFSGGKVVQRSTLNPDNIAWTATEEKIRGHADIDVSPGAVVHCFANYNGVTQAHWWVADTSTAQNSRCTVYEAFDGELAILKEFLTRSNARGRDARDLETAVAWLFWMLGFGVVHLGATGRTQDAADLIASTPSGNFAVVECTTGLLRTDSKLPLLIARTERVRQRLAVTTNRHLKIIPVMVTTLTKDEIRADIEQAERLGVLVLARDFLDEAATRARLVSNPDQMYAQAETTIAEAIARHTNQNIPIANG
jgi:hypothetical protein